MISGLKQHSKSLVKKLPYLRRYFINKEAYISQLQRERDEFALRVDRLEAEKHNLLLERNETSVTMRESGTGSLETNAASYQDRIEKEIATFRECENVHELPDIFHYWSNKYLVPKFKPFGFSNPQEFFCKYMTKACEESLGEKCSFLSVGAGNCDVEVDVVERLLAKGRRHFTLKCLDLNEEMLKRGKELARKAHVSEYLTFNCVDINSGVPDRQYRIVMANQALHHFVELEILFDKVASALHPDGYFVTDDMIGRNGHMRWPEALRIVEELWSELPDRYKYNHQLKQFEKDFMNWDCSTEGFEGVRAQDILPLLLKKFGFEFFIAFGNIIDPFVDRSFGHNFDPDNEFDRSFIDRVQASDDKSIEQGIVKPTHMMAAMTTNLTKTVHYKHLTPEFCVR